MSAAQISAKQGRGATNATSIAAVKIARRTSDRCLATRRAFAYPETKRKD